MGIPLYLLISGTLLYWGLLLVAAGVITSARRRRVGRTLAWTGMVCILASAVPLHSVLYAALLLLLVGWQVASARPGILKHLWTAAVLGGVVLTSAAALLDAPASRTTLSASTPIFVIGDSLSAGMGASDEGTWPQLLSRRLNLEVHNLARPGATLADGKVQAGAIPITSRPLVARRAGWCALERHVGLDDNGIEADGLAQLHFS